SFGRPPLSVGPLPAVGAPPCRSTYRRVVLACSACYKRRDEPGTPGPTTRLAAWSHGRWATRIRHTLGWMAMRPCWPEGRSWSKDNVAAARVTTAATALLAARVAATFRARL